MKITIVYESMFGNTHEVAQAISEGAREASPDADVECVAVGDASPEMIKSIDLLVVEIEALLAPHRIEVALLTVIEVRPSGCGCADHGLRTSPRCLGRGRLGGPPSSFAIVARRALVCPAAKASTPAARRAAATTLVSEAAELVEPTGRRHSSRSRVLRRPPRSSSDHPGLSKVMTCDQRSSTG
jgi:hypothetical protein